jgi:hypothetical protein
MGGFGSASALAFAGTAGIDAAISAIGLATKRVPRFEFL